MRLHANVIEYIAELNQHHYIEFVDVEETILQTIVTVQFDDGEMTSERFAKP